MKLSRSAWLMMVLALMVGCNNKDDGQAYNAAPKNEKKDEHGHEHPDHGPHNGHLIELGSDEYHAELVHDDEKKTVTIWILDGAAKNSVPIEASEVTLSIAHGETPENFSLKAAPVEGEKEGTSSRFESSEEELFEEVEHGHEMTVQFTIKDKSYRGTLKEHDHDHDHDHEKEE